MEEGIGAMKKISSLDVGPLGDIMRTASYFLVLAALFPSAAAAQVTPLSADSVAGSICLNVHNEFFPSNAQTPVNFPYNYVTTYTSADGTVTTFNDQFFAVTLPAVKAAGVRCLRVGAAAPSGDGGTHPKEFFLRLNTENADGFALDTVTPPTNIDSNFASGGGWAQAEGANEPDLSQPCSTIIADQRTLYSAIKGDSNPQIAALPVLGPSLTVTYPPTWLKTCPTFAGIADIGNWHPYNHANNPEAAGWLYSYFAHAQALYPSMPIYASEYGLRTVQPGEVAKQNPVAGAPNDIITRYLPRVVLTMLNLAKDASGKPMGFARTYWHQVADAVQSPTKPNAGYGVFFDKFGNPKPQGVAMGNMIHMFSDPSPVTPIPLTYTVKRVRGNAVKPQTMLFQRSDGHYMLPIWIGQPGWNGATYTYMTVLSEVVNVQLGTSAPSVEIDTFNDDGTVSKRMVIPVNGLFQMTATDHLQILVF
jgi:hypothetical protein